MVGQSALVLYAFGPHCELYSRDGFVDVALLERASGDDAGAASAGKRVFEDSGEFRVAIGNMFSGCGERRDDVSEAGEGKIDLLGLLQVLAFDSALPDLFTARQVDETQLCPVLLVVTAMDAIDEENGMAPRRAVIIVGAGDLPILVSEPYQIHHFQMILNLHLHQTLKNHRIV